MKKVSSPQWEPLSPHTQPPTGILKARANGERKTSGLPWTGSLILTLLQLCQTSKTKARQSVQIAEKKSWKLFWMPTSSEESQDQKACPPKTPNPLDAVSCLPKVKASFMSFPSSPSNLLGSEPCMGSQPPGAWVPAFDCHRAGRLPPGSRSQEPDSCWSLVTPYPGGGSMSTVKLQIPSL